ncbi:hypothetical protein MSAN_00352600 [Mycena sanguinolenta]|uniref:JmjC domain-containing protein n=1 Tax=Mycena sanguinolenta TaxID=230812 RepID=A0A8H6ZE93_9AGAR|nr:hypothetical protein MSAN_00352600 [Mycena sanguinolenta]
MRHYSLVRALGYMNLLGRGRLIAMRQARCLQHIFRSRPTVFRNFLKAVSACNMWLSRQADPNNINDAANRKGVTQWLWGQDLLSPLNNDVRIIIGQVLPPLIVMDTLLHISDPRPVPVVPRAASRPSLNLSRLLMTRSDWTAILRDSHACYTVNVKKLAETAATRGVSKKADLLSFWRDLRVVNPLLSVVRNLTHVSLVLSLYLLGDVALSKAGRAEYLLQSARSIGVPLSSAEAQAAVTDTDLGLMTAPLLVALAQSPLLLLGPISYASTPYKSRIALLETWRGLGNIHRVDLYDPLGRIEVTLFQLIFRLALREITELQVLHFFYTDVFVKQILGMLDQGISLQPPGYGLHYAGDILDTAPDLIEIEPIDNDVGVHIASLVDEKNTEEPPKKKRKVDTKPRAVDNGNSAGPSRSLRSRSGQTAQSASGTTLSQSGVTHPARPAATPARSRAVGASTTSARSKSRSSMKPKTPARVEDEDDDDEEVQAPLSYRNLRSLAVIDDWKPPLLREVDSILQAAQDSNRVLDPTLLYDLASDDFTVEIDYWAFSPASDNPSDPLVAECRKFQYRPFHETRSEAAFLRKMLQSRRLKTCKESSRDLPLHVHPDAQKFRHSGPAVSDDGQPLLPDIFPSDNDSIVYVVHEDTWQSLTARQRQEVLRSRAVLVVHRGPYRHDGQILKFDEDGMSVFSHPDRLAFLQDLGARRDKKDLVLQVGRPRDLLACRKARLERESAADAATGNTDDPPQDQRLNLLGNTLQSTSLSLPSGWTDLATHEYACTWLEHLSQVPPFVFPWSEVTWNIAANARAVSWLHGDVLFTIVDMPVGEKLWFLASRRNDLELNDHRGIMRSRHAFNSFNGWTDMSDVWNFEQLHLSPYTTLYMPATFLHAVVSLTDCIGVGRHGVPISNLSHCVYITLHNTVVSKSTTNADHEPARRFLVRIFIFIVLALKDPRNGAGGRGRSEGDGISPQPSSRTKAHLPDLSTNDGVLDLLALRSFIVLIVALNSSTYQYTVDRDKDPQNLLPLETEAARELSLAWKLAYDLTDYVSYTFDFKKVVAAGHSTSDVRSPTSFAEAADLSLVTMAVSMYKYISDTDKKSLAKGFNTDSFKKQAMRMLMLFELHQTLTPAERDVQLFANPDGTYKASDVSPSAEFSRYIADRTRSFSMLQPWDSASLPFSLVYKSDLV